MAQLVKNPPAVWETWVLSLGWENPLEKGKATHSSILAWRIPYIDYTVHGIATSSSQLSDFPFPFHLAAVLWVDNGRQLPPCCFICLWKGEIPVQLLSCVRLFANPWTEASGSFPMSWLVISGG